VTDLENPCSYFSQQIESAIERKFITSPLPSILLHQFPYPLMRYSKKCIAIDAFHISGCNECIDDSFFGGFHRGFEYGIEKGFG
jgi:hypothetical protein